MAFFKSKGKNCAADGVDFHKLPRHIAIIMDGNGRWAQKRGLPNNVGHKKGAEVFEIKVSYNDFL
jgi:undecaprenyl diphosphate synthase